MIIETERSETKRAIVTPYHSWLLVVCSALSLPLLAQAELPVVQLIATGGTIAMKIDPIKKAPVPALTGEDLISTVPEIAHVESNGVTSCHFIWTIGLHDSGVGHKPEMKAMAGIRSLARKK